MAKNTGSMPNERDPAMIMPVINTFQSMAKNPGSMPNKLDPAMIMPVINQIKGHHDRKHKNDLPPDPQLAPAGPIFVDKISYKYFFGMRVLDIVASYVKKMVPADHLKSLNLPTINAKNITVTNKDGNTTYSITAGL